MGYLSRRLLGAALTANAVRPPEGGRAGLLAFAPGWIVGELAPQLLLATAADTAVAVARRRATPLGLSLAAGTAVGLGHLLRQSLRVDDVLDDALAPAIGPAPVAEPTAAPPERPVWRQLVNPFRMTDARVRVDRDLRFSDAGGRGLLDVYRPAWRDASNAPVLLQIHGGGWILGRKDQQGVPLMHHMAAQGWVVVALNYRLAPRDPWPAQIVDVKRAIAWIREHIAEYGGDPDYLAVTGGSAGGHLTALAALTPNDPAFQPGFEEVDTRVDAAVPFYGVYDVAGSIGLPSAVALRDTFFAPRVMQKRWSEDPEPFELASPILRITPEAPDFFVIHGDRDSLVAVDQARHFVARLRDESRRTVAYAELPDAQHAFDVFPSVRTLRVVAAVDRFLTWHRTAFLAGRPAARH